MAKLATLLLILTISTLAKPLQSTSTSTSTSTSIEFVRSSCSSTLYPAICFSSLSPYASTINNDPLKLSQLATVLAHARIKSVSARVSSLYLSTAAPSSTADPANRRVTIAKALKDCTQVLGSAADRAKDSIAELKKLNTKNDMTESRWCLSNVQTWMSAALTNEDTCTDGLKEADGAAAKGSVAVDVGGRVGVAMEYTSNALAFVNKLATGTS